MARKCHICGDLHLEYTTAVGKRPRYFCSERHALEYQMKQINKSMPKGSGFSDIGKMQKNPYFEKLYKKMIK